MSVLCLFRRMFENKINELEKELSRKTSGVSELKQRLKETSQRQEEAQITIRQLQDQVMVPVGGAGSTSTTRSLKAPSGQKNLGSARSFACCSET